MRFSLDIAKYLLKCGANSKSLTDDQETPLDLVDSDDFEMMALLMQTKLEVVKRKLSENIVGTKVVPEWVRRESVQEEVSKNKTVINQNIDKTINKSESLQTIKQNKDSFQIKDKETFKLKSPILDMRLSDPMSNVT